jgi:hypothetical protein
MTVQLMQLDCVTRLKYGTTMNSYYGEFYTLENFHVIHIIILPITCTATGTIEAILNPTVGICKKCLNCADG